nr:VOC family protein [Jeotgalibacillus soli]
MMFQQLHHIAIICTNYEHSKHFYTNILGFTVINEVYRKDRDSYKLDLQGEGFQLELFSFPQPPKRVSRPEAAGLRHLAFQVENVDQVIEYLTSFSIMVEDVRIDPFTGKRFTFFSDPDGLPIEVVER